MSTAAVSLTNQPLRAYPGCPTLSWIIASRVTNPYEESDAFIVASGRKGSGKSTATIALCENIAGDIARLRGLGEDPQEFFNIDHIVSVTKEGAIRLLTSGILNKINSVVLLDDVSIQWNSRQFMTWINQALNDILTIARVYQCVIVCNCVQKSHIDKVAREMIDYEITMIGKNTRTQQAIFKCYYFEVGPQSQEYRKFLHWHGMRIKYWIIGKPSEKLEAEYKAMRFKNTGEHIERAYLKMKEKLDPDGQPARPDKRIKDYATHPTILKYRDKVMTLKAAGKRTAAIARETGLTPWWVSRCLSP